MPRLQRQLFDSEIFVEIGNENFRIPRDLFSSPGDNPNYFTLGFTIFFSSPGDTFPGLNPRGLLRPPAIHPPSIPGRSPQVFREILHFLRGYSLPIRDNEHRAELLKDARYYNLRSLEQKLILHDISYNMDRGISEICIRIQDLKPSGVSYVGDDSSAQPSLGGWVNYARPYVDETTYELVLEIDDESTRIDLRSMRADLHGTTKARVTSLFQIIANKMNLPTTIPLGLRMSGGGASSKIASPGDTPLSDDKVKIRIDSDAHITLDGVEHAIESSSWLEPLDAGTGEVLESSSSSLSSAPVDWPFPSEHTDPTAPNTAGARVLKRPLGSPSPLQLSKRRKRSESEDDSLIWMIRRGQWRLRVQTRADQQRRDPDGEEEYVENGPAMEIVMVAVKLDAISGQRGRNTLRKFLS